MGRHKETRFVCLHWNREKKIIYGNKEDFTRAMIYVQCRKKFSLAYPFYSDLFFVEL